jgi:RNA polymerase sigma factor (sigma-70 family)
MSRTLLHLVDRQGRALSAVQQTAIEAAHRWAVREFPRIDQASLANWTEEVGAAMAQRGEDIKSPRRYAFAALHGKIREYFRSGGTREITVGISSDLEKWAGVDGNSTQRLEREVLFEQLSLRLSERDRHILVLLQQDKTKPASVAAALGVSDVAARKAIQRVKERMAAILTNDLPVHESGKPYLRRSEN